MNNKKNKGKSRGKTATKTTQEENMDNIEVPMLETLNTDETRVPEIVTESINIVENDQSMADVPKKPKRSKNSKKKEHLLDIKTKEENVEIKETKDVSENIENATENIPISACVRKKKKKTKKQDENLKGNLDSHAQVVALKYEGKESEKETGVTFETDERDPICIQILPENIDVAHKEDALSKKKKKKKHCHDSDKSANHDPCTMAFQKLIVPLGTANETDNNNSTEIQQIMADTKECTELIPLINPDQVSEETKSAESTIKKKNKKGKKNPSQNRIDVERCEEATADKNIRTVSKEDITCLENSENKTVIEETIAKPKAKIVKPVQKKLRNKSECESVKTSSDQNFEIDTSGDIEKQVLNTDGLIEKTNTVENKYHPDNAVSIDIITASPTPEIFKSDDNDNKVVEIGQSQLMKQEIENESKDSSEMTNMSENKKKPETSSTNSDDLGFVEVKTGKGKKKRNKSVFTPDLGETIEINALDNEKDEQNLDLKCTKKSIGVKSEDPEAHTIIIPDLIEYPRSTSQQHIDSNNNTYIQEIPSTEEVKLDIPVYTSTPIIQGSGESPETKLINLDIITEIDVQPSSIKENIILQSAEKQTSENIDIKSKMYEVNRDMEELKRSIERSLAELTATEKSGTEVDKEFEELFQSQTVKPPQIDKNKNDDLESSFNDCEKKNDIEMAENSEKTDELNKNLELKEIEKVKTDDKNVDLINNPLSVETLNASLISDNSETKSAAVIQQVAPVCPARRDKGKNKSKKKGKKEALTTNSGTNTSYATSTSRTQTTSVEKEANQKSETTQEKEKQQTSGGEKDTEHSHNDMSFEPIENFEDALTSSVDDINQTFEIIVKDATQSLNSSQYQNNPKINIISPTEDSEGEEKQDKNESKDKQNPISRPKNLLGSPNIPASSNKTDFKKEKSKPPNSIQAKVKIKDSVEIEQAANKKSLFDQKKLIKESNRDDTTYLMKTNEDLIYKYSFRKVFLQNTCHVCKKDLVHRVPCKFCSLVFYCSQKHKDEDWSQHQSLCFAVCTIAHLKEQKHIYAGSQNILGHNYRVLRMQTILSCEKILNRKLVPWEQEALLYPRLCSDVKCRQWKQGQLKDCTGCGQLSYCIDYPEHLPPSHQRWCKSYALYQRLVNYQLTKGRLEPLLPTKVLNHYQLPGKINDVLGSIYEEKIDMDDIQYAALTQIATAPLTAAYSYQIHYSKMNSICANGIKKNSVFTIHIVGAELPFEADSLNKWETFFLHLRSDVKDLRVVMVGPDINSSKLPLDLLANVKLCENCQTNKRRVLFDFYDNENYHDYYSSDDFVTPDIVCAFNQNIHRAFAYDIETWPSTINSILKQRVPFVLTSYSIEELRRDLGKVRECARVDFNVVSEIKYNPFSSVRPDRNFITDHEIPLLFKNYCFCIICGTL
ncbi:centrosomal protein of 290 kDa [Maniola jurtina]|uniref:centrosomal protein of 290 kDa n=1 Tax=Maniola jurtina TaxID=191418 RepID=UPI001E68F06E|nr:centrosomal protein of 290 kDa [Maniola jurtina]